ncbi:neuroblast differentiation-associated protein AHNAK isoform X2 [Paralichthys olivaceus]
MFEKRSTPKMNKLKEVHSPESEVIVKTATDGCAEGLVYGGGGKEGIFIKGVVPESPASKSLQLKEGDQILSATVYFDNVPYEDAIQILEHAQAYKLKLCLKRKPDITETEAAMESDIIPEEELCAPEMREQGKTKRRGDARISWPKFPSFGKGRKTRFTRSHSSSEADEQRKLELSPTTSDTESPIKSQDALKGKKRHKMKLSLLTKRSRISSSEDTDAPTNGQTSSDVYQTASDMLSHECLESLSGETPKVYVSEELRLDQDDLTEPQTARHKVELISVDSTLKTADLTVALADQGSPSAIKSPSEKKKKKERSELKIKILGKDKSHKKEAKAKASPKRLKTLGASIEKADQPINGKSDSHTDQQRDQPRLEADTQMISSDASRAKLVTTQMEMNVPKVELDISDVSFMRKSHQKGEEQAKKDKETKQKKETKTCPTFKLPKIGLGEIATEETIQTSVNVEFPTKMEVEGKAVKEDPYDRLSKSSHSKTQLPKREDIEIPGMEDMSVKIKAKGIKGPKVVSTGRYEEIQTEDVQMSIDVNSVKEAVSKLPGFKLPKMDTSGMPIPEEITVIDANAQRISVKTPTKVADTKSKHEAHLIKFDTTPADLTSEELLIETKVDYKKPEKIYITTKQSDHETQSEFHKREDIIIPGKESVKKDFGFKLPKQNISGQEDSVVLGERTILLQDITTSKTETRKGKGQIGGVMYDVKIPEIDSIEYIDSVGGSPAKKGGGVSLTGFAVHLDATKPKADISFPDTRGEDKDVGPEEHPTKLVKFAAVAPSFSVKVPDVDKNTNIDGAEIEALQRKGEESKYKIPNLGVTLGSVDVAITEKKVNVEKPEVEIKPLQTDVDLDGEGRKFKMPKVGVKMPKIKGPEFDLSSSKKDIDVKLPEAKVGVKLPEAPESDITLGNIDVSIPEQKVEVQKPEVEIKSLLTEVEVDGQGSKFKMPKFGIKMPKIKGPEFDLSLSKKDIDVTLPEVKAGVKLPESPEVDVTLGGVDVSIPEQKVEIEKPELEIKPLQTDVDLDGEGRKFKMPKFGIKMPKIKGPEFDLSSSKKEVDVKLPEVKAGVKLPEAPAVDVTLRGVDVSIPEQKVEVQKPAVEIKSLLTEVELDGQGSKFKMPKFGIKMPKVKGPEFDLSSSKKEVDVKLPEAPEVDVTLGGVDVSIPEQKVEVEKPVVEIKPLQTEVDLDGEGSKFKMPKFGIKMPKVKGPEFDLSLSKKEVDLKLPEAPAVDVTLGGVDVSIPEQKVEVDKPVVEIKPLQTEVEVDGEGSRFKMPKFGISMPKVKGPDIDFSLSKKDVDVTLPEAKAEVSLPDVELKEPSAKVDIKAPEVKVAAKDTSGSPSRFKMPTFSFSKSKVKVPDIDLNVSKKDTDITSTVKLPEAPTVDVSLGKAEVLIPEATVEVKKPEVQIKPLHAEVELDGQGRKFKMPKFGITMPKVKGPDIDLSFSKKDVDVKSPEAEFKLPEAPEMDVKIRKAEVSIPDVKMEVDKPELEMQPLETQVELDGHGSRFKMPQFGISMPKVKGPDIDFSLSKKDVDVTLPEAKAEVSLPDVELKDPSVKVEIRASEYEAQVEGSPSKFKLPTFKLPKFGIAAPSVTMEVPDMDKDKATVDIAAQNINIEGPSLDVKMTATDGEGKESKFKVPGFGISLPKVQGPNIDLSLSKKDVDVKSPEAEFKLPEAPEMDVKLGKAEVSIPDVKMEVDKPELEMQPLETQVELDGHGSRFKMPKFGISMPKVKGPDIDFSLSKKDVDVTLPEAKAEVSLPDVELKEPSAKVDIKAPEIKVAAKDTSGSPSRFKMPTFSFSKSKVKVPDIDLNVSKKDTDITSTVKLPEAPTVDVSLGKAEVLIPEATVEVKKPEVQIKPLHAEVELDGHGSRFKMPKFGITMPKVKGPDIDLSFSKKDVDVKSPEAEFKLPEAPEMDVKLGKAEVSIPDVKMEVDKPELEMQPLETQVELDGHGSRFKMPKFGISMPKVKGPDIDFSLSKKDVDVTLPEAKAEVSLPDVELKEPSAKVEVKGPEVKVAAKDTSGSPSRFKMPTFSFSKPKVKVPDIDLNVSKKDTDITSTVKLPEAPTVDVSLGKAEVLIPEATVEAKKPEVQIKPLHADVELDGHGSRFKMPKFGITMPKVKGPDIDLSFSKKGVDVKSPEAEFKLPEAPEMDVKLGKAEVSIPDVKMEVDKPELEMQPLETQVELDGHGSRFKMPKFGISMPKVKGPDIDLSLSKKDVDVTLPEAKAEIELPDVELKDPSVKVEIRASEYEAQVEGSPSKFKLPTFKLPKFGIAAPSVTMEVPDMDKDKATVDIAAQNINIEGPSLDVKMTATDGEGKESKFKVPGFGISLPKVQGPKIDLSLSKKDVDVKSPEAEFKLPEAPEMDVKLGKAEVSIPDVKMEVDKPELEMQPLETQVELDGHGSRFKMPKFGISMPKVKGPDIDFSLSKKDVDVTLPEAKAEVSLPDVELKEPSTKVEVKGPEVKVAAKDTSGSPSRFKMPTFSFSKPKVKVPDIDLNVSKKDTDITSTVKLPEAPTVDVSLGKAEVLIPEATVEAKKPEVQIKPLDAEVELDGQGRKFKMPKFGITMPKVKGPDIDLSFSKKDVDVKSPEAEFKLPEAPEMDVKLGKAEVSIPDVKMEVDKPELEMQPLETQVELDGHGSRFKMPKFGISMPKVKGPDIDFSLSKKDIDVTLPEAKAEVSLPDVELKEPSAKVDIKAPEIKVAAKDTSGSPSRFKMPTFSFSKPKVKVPDIDLNVSKKDTDITSTVKPPEAPTVDVSLGKAEVLIPEATVEAKKPEVQIKPLHAEVELDGHGSRFKMPKFGITMPKVKGPDIDLSFSKKGVDVKSPEAEFKLPEAPEMDVKLGKAEVSIPDVKMEVDKPELEMQPLETQVELDGHGSRFKMPKFGISMPKVKGPEIDFSLSKKDVDVTLPEAKAEVNLPDVELQESSTKVEVKGPEVEAQLGSMKGSPSKFKLPTFKFPKFGVSTPNVSAEVSDTEHKIKIDGADISVPNTDVEVKGEVSLPEVEVKEGGVVIEQPGVEVDAKMKKPKFSLPRFSFSKSSVNAPEVDVSVQNVNVELPEGKVEVKGGEVDLKPPEEEAEIDRQGSKFKMPKFGISLPKVTGPEFDLSLSSKDVDVKIPEAKAEVKLPDVDLKEPSAEVEIKPPEIKVVTKDTEGSPSKYKMPTFKLPKFGIGSPSSTIEVPDMDTDVKINGGDIEIPEKVVAVDISAPSIDTEGPSIDLKTTAAEREGKGSKFKLPSLSFSVPQVKSPDVDLSLAKTSVDVRLPEAKADVQLPEAQVKELSAKVEIKSPGIEVHTSNVEGSPSKFKMPTFKLPKFGTSTTQISVEVPDVDKDIKVDGEDFKLPEAKAEVKLPDVEIKEPVQSSISVSQAPMAEGDAKVKKTSWTLPRFSFPKTNIKSPEAEVNLDTPKVDVSLPEVKAEVRLPDVDKESSSISVEGAANIDLDAKLKKPKFSMPKFSFSKQSSKELEVDASLPEVDVSLPEGNVGVAPSEVDVKPPEGDVKLDGQESKFKMPKFGISMPKVKGPHIDLSLSKKDVDVIQPKTEVEIPEGPKLGVDVKPSECEAEIDGQGGKFKMPKFGISMPKVKGPEIDLSLSKKDRDVTLPEAEAEVQLPDVKIKQPSGKVEIKAAEIKAGNVEGSPSKLKMPTFTLPKFGASTPKVSVQVPDVDKDIQIDDAKLEVLKEGATVTVTAPSIDAEGLSVNMKAKAGELEGSEGKFKMPHIGITVPKVKGPEIDLSLSKKCPDVTLPEGKVEVTLPSAEVIEPEGAVETVETEAKSKRPNWTFPKFSFSRTSGKAPDVDVNLETPKADVASPEVEAEVCLPHVKVKEPSGKVSVEEPPAVELDGNLKKSKFSLPKFSFSKSSVTMPEISAEPPQVDVSLPEGEVIVKQPEMEIKAPELEDQLNVQGSKFKFPKFGIALPKAEGPEVDLNASQRDVEVTLPNVKAEVKLPEVEDKESSSNVEADAKKKDVGGSPLKFKMPTKKMPKFGGASYDVTVETPDVDKAEKDAAKLEDVTVEIKAPSVDIKTEPKAVITDSETPKTETDGVSHGSPSRFKLPTFKMPKLSFSKSKPEEEHGDSDGQEDQPEREEETKSPKLTLTSFGEILKNIDVEFDVSKTEEENLKASKEVHETSEPRGKELDAKEKETTTKLDTPKSPERTGWFKFPKFGLSSPSESAKMPEKDEHKDGKTPETGDEEISPTCSVQSSDAFADISSTMTSEHVGLSISSPTKVTVKYSDPDAAPSLEEMHSSVITSTTRTELISVEPNLPEKITILSSGVSSSSEDTLRLESGKIHVITSNIQATPESQHAKLLTAVQVQSAGGPPLQSEGEEAASWTVEDPQGGRRTVFERHIVRGTSSERSESKETIVITKQITRIFDSSEPISGETATSIQRLRDSVHSEKMRFFDGAEK